MRIRAGFVSNSSSTSFLILTDDQLTENGFLELMGASRGSPLLDVFRELFRLIEERSTYVNFADTDPSIPATNWFAESSISPYLLERLEDAKSKGLKAYFGRLNSDGTRVESFFCMDPFEVENEHIYMNYLECVW